LLLLFTGYVQLLVYTLGTQNTGHHLIPEVRERDAELGAAEIEKGYERLF